MARLKFVTDYDRHIEKQSKTFEDRLCDAITNNKDLTSLLEEAKEIKRVGYFTDKEYKTLTNIELYKEILT